MEFKNKIKNIIKAATANPGTETRYREPLVGFASADDPIFNEMIKIIGPHQVHPKEIFPEAKTVVSFFLPFEKELVKLNWKSPDPVKEWIQAKGETDRLIGEINEKLKAEFRKRNFVVTKKERNALSAWTDVRPWLLMRKGLIKKSVSDCFRRTQKLFPKLINLPAENVLPAPVLSGLAE